MIVTIHHMEQTFAKYLSTFVKYSFILISRLKLTEMLYELKIKTDMGPFKPVACYSNHINQVYVNLTRFFLSILLFEIDAVIFIQNIPPYIPFQIKLIKISFQNLPAF